MTKQINKCSLLFSADARSKFDLKDVPSEEIITIFVSEMAVSSMTSSVFFTGSRVEMDVPKARILHTQICKNIPMRAYYLIKRHTEEYPRHFKKHSTTAICRKETPTANQ